MASSRSLRTSHFIKHLSSLVSLPVSKFPRENVIASSLRSKLSTFYCLPTIRECRSRNGSISFPSHLLQQRQRHLKTNTCRFVREILTASTSIDDPSTPCLSVQIRCRKEFVDALSEALLCFGASSVSMEELSDYESTDEICITSVFADHQDVRRCISCAADSIGLEQIPRYEVTKVEQCDWIKNVQESFQPVKITDGLWIIPEWRTPPDLQATNIFLNPGLAFGTGEHPTTKLCLLLLHELIKGGECFLDYGTGSGILGIVAVKLGAAFSVGIDIDPQAITSARLNAVLNNVQPNKMQLYLASHEATPLSPDGSQYDYAEDLSLYSKKTMDENEKYDVVIANILLNPLTELADHIVSYAKPGAVVGLSGIISEQLPQMEECYSKYLDRISVSEMDGWACVRGTKKVNHMNR